MATTNLTFQPKPFAQPLVSSRHPPLQPVARAGRRGPSGSDRDGWTSIWPQLIGKNWESHLLYNPYAIYSMYGIFINICPKNHPKVGKYTIHGVYG